MHFLALDSGHAAAGTASTLSSDPTSIISSEEWGDVTVTSVEQSLAEVTVPASLLPAPAARAHSSTAPQARLIAGVVGGGEQKREAGTSISPPLQVLFSSLAYCLTPGQRTWGWVCHCSEVLSALLTHVSSSHPVRLPTCPPAAVGGTVLLLGAVLAVFKARRRFRTMPYDSFQDGM